MLVSQADLPRLLATRTPLIDLRAPAEYAQGAFPASVSLPLMTDDERHQVGLRYKAQGQQSAIHLGHELVGGSVREARVDAWIEQLRNAPNSVLYCWRGGLRSEVAQGWLRDRGFKVPRVAGGYKALRRLALEALTSLAPSPQWIVLGGRTGSGKTDMLAHIAHSIDLEALAAHRGSAFGAMGKPQPTQSSFENALASAWLALQQAQRRVLVLEDEGRMIGRLAIPEAFAGRMNSSPVVVVDVPLTERTKHIYREYIDKSLPGGRDLEFDAALNCLQQHYDAALNRIQKRLGGARHQTVREELHIAFDQHRRSRDGSAHERWIESLLKHYYDPMYEYQLRQKQERIVFRGTRDEVIDYLREKSTP